MDAWMEVLGSGFLLIMTIVIDYRLPRRTLGLRYPGIPTFLIMLTVQFFAGRLNMNYHLAADIEGNTLYYGFITFGLYLLLFRGSIIKKIFFTALISCGLPISFYIFLPFTYYFLSHRTEQFLIALRILEFVNILLSAVGMEYVGKKFQNIRKEFPPGYTLYLIAVILFVHVAIYASYDRMLMLRDAVLSPFAAFTMTAFAAFGIVIVATSIFEVDRQVNVSLKEQLHVMQAENFKSRELEWRKFLIFRHDIKNHLICLSGLLENDKTEQAVSYMHNLTDTVNQFDSPVQTGNDYADALLSVKYAEAVAAGIRVSIEMAIPSRDFVEPVDLCCILSNAFDNAIAACNRLAEGERWISARAFVRQGQLVIAITNSKPPYVTVADGQVSPKEITADHGLGLDAVKAVVQKYEGILNLSADDVFSFSVLLPL